MERLERILAGFLALVIAGAGVVLGVKLQHGQLGPELVAGVVVVLWLALLASYFVWALYRYNVNYGLTDHEWKVLYPEFYAAPGELAQYQRLHRQFLESRAADAKASVSMASRFEPPGNPYSRDSFGLPPGTIRGAMALTALVLFSSVELVNVYTRGTGWEAQFHELITAFMMVLAFYFGSRAVEALKDRDATKPGTDDADRAVPGSRPAQAAQPAHPAANGGEPARPEAPQAEEAPKQVDAPSQQPALPAHFRDDRLSSLVVQASATTSPEAQPASGLRAADPLAKRVMALTASFETGAAFPQCFAAVAGSFDGMGLSFGALQWNLGMGSLQPLWREMREEHDPQLRAALEGRYGDFCKLLDLPTKEAQVQWAVDNMQRQEPRNGKDVWVLDPSWRAALAALGVTDEMVGIQIEAAAARYRTALGWCREWDLATERAVALMFDINVQNGKIDKGNVRFRIEDDIDRLPKGLPPLDAEMEKLSIIATRRAEVVDPRWRQDVLQRKLTIARGEGVVHGRRFDLLREFAIGLRPAGGAAIPLPEAPAGAGAPPFPAEFPRDVLVASETAARLQLDNTPDAAAERNLARLCTRYLVPIGRKFGGLRVTSGYRSPAVNKAVGGSPNSAHQYGRAADVVPVAPGVTLESVIDWVRGESGLDFDQLILEFGRWVHVGVAEEGAAPRKQVLRTTEPGKYEAYGEAPKGTVTV